MAGQTDDTERRFAVITGASSGIGYELARQFASHGFDVLMTADGVDLEAAAARLQAEVPTAVTAVQADLADHDEVERLAQTIRDVGLPVDALALNAGFGNGGAFLDIPLADELRLIDVNVGAVVHLAKRVLPSMVARGTGGVLITSSVAATMPGPFYATYAASKSFLQSFAEAIRYELKDTGVTVTALQPGPTDTDFFATAGMDGTPAAEGKKDDPAKVAQDGFEALMKGKDAVVAGSLRNKAQTAATSVIPDAGKAALHAQMTKPPTEDD